MLNPNFFNTVFVIPILNVLLVFFKAFEFIKVPGAFGFAIIALTVFIRFVLHPFFKQQMHGAKKMNELKPHLDKLHAKHKDDKTMLQQAQMKLFKEHNYNPASGCLFALIQIPVFIALYSTLNLFLSNGNFAQTITEINKAVYFSFLKIQSIDPNFFGFNLAKSPAQAKIWFYYLIPVVTALLQYLQAKVTMPAPVQSTKVGEKKEDGSDFQKAMTTQMKYVLPVMIGYFAYTLPIGLSLYWNIFSLFSIMQYRKTQS